MYFETLFSTHNKYILNILQQLTQSQRLKNVFTVLEGSFKNIDEWIHSNLHTDLIKCIFDSKVHKTSNTRRTANELIKQRRRKMVFNTTLYINNQFYRI